MKLRYFILLLLSVTLTLTACTQEPANPNPDTPPVVEEPDGPEEPGDPSTTITGAVLTSSGTPLINASVTLLEYELTASDLTAQSSAFTDEDGHFSVTAHAAGLYALEIRGDQEGLFQLITINEDDDAVTHQDLALTAAPYGMVELTVTKPDDMPAVNALVFLAGTNHIGITNSHGRTILTRVPEGEYEALATLEAHKPSASTTVIITSGETTSGPTLQLRSLAPVIHSITPVVTYAPHPWYVTPIVITGENFGSNASTGAILIYEYYEEYLKDIRDNGNGYIHSWSDTEIVFRVRPTHMHLNQHADRTKVHDWNRFKVITAHGESELSERVDLIYARVSPSEDVYGPNSDMRVDSPSDPLYFTMRVIGSSPEAVEEAITEMRVGPGSIEFSHATPTETQITTDYVIHSRLAHFVYTPASNVQHGDQFRIDPVLNGEPQGQGNCSFREIGTSTIQYQWRCNLPS